MFPTVYSRGDTAVLADDDHRHTLLGVWRVSLQRFVVYVTITNVLCGCHPYDVTASRRRTPGIDSVVFGAFSAGEHSAGGRRQMTLLSVPSAPVQSDRRDDYCEYKRH